MNLDCDFIKQTLLDMAEDKFSNMYESEISDEVYEFLKGKEKEVAEKAYELFFSNAKVNEHVYAYDDLTDDLILDWSLYEDLSPKDRENEVTYDCLYNFDALWMTAIQKCFPNKVTNTKCGWGMIEMKNYQKNKERVRNMAIEWQMDFCNHDYSWGELCFYGELFSRLGRRYGLLTEFKENGIV